MGKEKDNNEKNDEKTQYKKWSEKAKDDVNI
jgi:hypothetical protein